MKLLTHTEPNKRNATTSRKYYDNVMKANLDVKFKFLIFPDSELTN